MSKLNVNDIEVGDYIVVTKNNWSITDRSYIGDVLRVEVVDLPFLRAKKMSGICYGYVHTLNVAEHDFMRPSNDHVNNVLKETNSAEVISI